jgi:hypothetical protein
MTLTTRIRIIEPYHAQAVMDEACRIIGAREPVQSHGPDAYIDDGRWEIRNASGQGFPALVWLYYGADAPLKGYDDEPNGPQEFAIELCIDTIYGYHAENGADCSDLHAWIVDEIGRWLDDKRLTWHWYNEYLGDWNRSTDDRTTLGDATIGAPAEGVFA